MVKGILAFIFGMTVVVIATAGEKDARKPATTVTASVGVVCGQGRTMSEAEGKLNDKLSTPSGEVVTSMSNKFGKIKNARTTGVSAFVEPSGANTTYYVCASLTGEQE